MAIQVGPPLITLDLTIGQVENLNPQGQAESGINTGVTLNTADTGITFSSGGVIKGGQTAFNTGNGFFLGYSGAQYKVSIGDPSGDNITWDGADLNITANTGEVTGNLTVSGNLTVNGTTTTLNTATLDVEDKNITLNYGSGDTSSTANGAGITIQDAVNSTTNATILWNGTTDAFDFSNSVNITGNITVSGTVDGRDVATDGTKLDGIEASADVTDTTNVTAAGALMDSELTSIASVKALNQGVATTDSPTFAGLTTTADVSFGDNDKAIFGAGSDLQIYHDGSNSYIQDQGLSGTGNLILAGADVEIATFGGNKYFLGSSNIARLYHTNNEKLATTSTGIDVTGNATFDDNGKAIFGAGSDLQIYHDGSHSYIDEQGSGRLYINSGNGVWFANSDGSEISAKLNVDSACEFRYDNAIKLATTSTGIDVTGNATFDDNGKAIFGAGSDLQIYHSGSASYITDSGTGNLLIQGTDVRLQNAGATANYLKGTDGAEVSLFYAGGEKLSTTATGIDVTGTVVSDGLTVSGSGAVGSFDRTDANAIIELKRSGSLQGYIGASTGGDIILYNASAAQKLRAADNGDISFYEDTGTTAKFFWDSSAESLAIGVSTANARLEVGAFATTSSDIAYFSNSNGSHKGIIRLDAQGDGEFVLRDAGNNEDVVITAGGDSYFNGGNVGIGTDSPAEPLHVQEGSSGITSKSGTIALIEGSGNTKLTVASGTTSTGELLFGSSADNDAGRIIYDHNDDGLQVWTNGSRAVDVDSSGNVGIGTSSPATLLELSANNNGGASNNTLRFTDTDTVTEAGQQIGKIEFKSNDASGDGALVRGFINCISEDASPSSAITFATNAGGAGVATAEAMRIDSSGNLLVGTTTTTAGNEGMVYFNGSSLRVTRDGDEPLNLDRLTSNGSLIDLKRDGTPFGSIGSNSSLPYFAGTSIGLKISSTQIRPSNSTGNNNDNAVDLGKSDTRFKDLYLSGVAKVDSYISLGNNGYIRGDASGELRFQGGSTATTFYNSDNTAERMSIDSSGNLLVGTTNVNPAANNVTGHALKAGGLAEHSNSGAVVMRLNRTDSDGDILQFYKGTGTVGSIGTRANYIKIGNGDTHLLFNSAADAVTPEGASANRDAAIDLGRDSSRFKDLYLSGGAYLGGTASANKLDHYEHGGWTPTADFSTTSPTSGASTGTGRYTKVGNVVTVWGTILNFNVTGAAGDLNITGLPFVARLVTSLQRYIGTLRITNCDFSLFTDPIQVNSQVLDNSSVVTAAITRDDLGSDGVDASALTDGVSDVSFTLIYETDA